MTAASRVGQYDASVDDATRVKRGLPPPLVVGAGVHQVMGHRGGEWTTITAYDWPSKFVVHQDGTRVTNVAALISTISEKVAPFKVGSNPVAFIESVIAVAHRMLRVPYDMCFAVVSYLLPADVSTSFAVYAPSTFSDIADLLVNLYYRQDTEFQMHVKFQRERMKPTDSMYGYYARLCSSARGCYFAERYVHLHWWETIPPEVKAKLTWSERPDHFKEILKQADYLLNSMRTGKLTFPSDPAEGAAANALLSLEDTGVMMIEDEDAVPVRREVDELLEYGEDHVEMVVAVVLGDELDDGQGERVDPIPVHMRIICKFCGYPNHSTEECRMKNRSCLHCKKFGHPSYWCPLTPSIPSRVQLRTKRRGGRDDEGRDRGGNGRSSYRSGIGSSSRNVAPNSRSVQRTNTRETQDRKEESSDKARNANASSKVQKSSTEQRQVLRKDVTRTPGMNADASRDTQGYSYVRRLEPSSTFLEVLAGQNNNDVQGLVNFLDTGVFSMTEDVLMTTHSNSKFSFVVKIGNREATALIDTGATISCVSAELVPEGTPVRDTTGSVLTAGEGRHTISGIANMTFLVEGQTVSHEMRVIPTFSNKFILGQDFIVKEQVDLQCNHAYIEASFKVRGLSVALGKQLRTGSGNSVANIEVATRQEAFLRPGEVTWVACFADAERLPERGVVVPKRTSITHNSRHSLQLMNDCMVRGDQPMRLPLMNCSMDIMHLHAGTYIGTLEEVSPDEEVLELSAVDLQEDPITQEWFLPKAEGVSTWASMWAASITSEPGGNDDTTTTVGEKQDLLLKKAAAAKDKAGEESVQQFHDRVDKKWKVLGDPNAYAILKSIFCRYDRVFYDKDQPVAPTSTIVHDIVLKPGMKPVFQKPRPVSEADREMVREAVEELALKGYIVPSKSDNSSRLVIVRKKDGSIRVCCDYRELNAMTVVDRYVPRRVDRILASLANKSVFSVMDLKASFYQIKLSKRAQALSSFSTTCSGQWEFVRMPFGLVNAPATFCRAIDAVIRNIETLLNPDGTVASILSAYVDDIIIASKDEVTHLKHLRLLLDAFEKASLTINPAKCQFMKAEVTFLGHTVSAKGKQPHTDKVATIKGWPVPKQHNEVRRFLGLVNYYREFIKGITAISEPLRRISHNAESFKAIGWGKEQQDAFDYLKRCLCEFPILRFPTKDGDYIIESDASTSGLGCTLMQRQGKLDATIAYGGRSLTPAETRYTATELECLGLYYALCHFHVYIHMRKVLIKTDHKALEYLRSKANTENPRLRAWSMLISIYDPKIVYVPAGALTNVDAISRKGDKSMVEPTELLAEEAEQALPGVKWPTANVEALGLAATEVNEEMVETLQTWDDYLRAHQANDPDCVLTRKIAMGKKLGYIVTFIDLATR